MASSKFSAQRAKHAGGDPEARNRQLLAVEADIQAGRLSDAATALNALAQSDPNDARVYVSGWLLANKAGNLDAALYSARRAVEMAPTAALAHYCLSETEHRRGDNAAARLSINQALMIEPANLTYRELAVNLAFAQADFATAEFHLRRAFALDSSIPGIKTMIGNALRHQSKFDEAETWLTDALALNDQDVEALHGLAMVAYLRDERKSAQQYLSRALQLRPTDAGFAYLDAVFRGEAPAVAPESMTLHLIDSDASRIDTQATSVSRASVAQRVAGAIVERYPDRKLNVLDLGCGTGLLAAALGRIDGYFVGVDLSMPMIETAKKRDVYSRFHHVNLLDALSATDGSEYEVIVATDVFIYLGKLDVAITDAFKVLRPGGWLFFSCEHADDDGPDFVVHKNMHYAQSRRYIKKLLSASGFAEPHIEDIDPSTEQSSDLSGFIVSVQKPT